MYALVDCNSFYANCEKLFRPDLTDRPVVVLSNNDGCVVARSAEAKALGVKMGAPYFKVKDFCQQHGVTVFSSNYALYADLSQRVMTTLERLCPTVEIYSIDEAFLYIADYPMAMTDLDQYARYIQTTVRRHTGIPVSVGIAATKTLAKLANHAAKHYPNMQDICVLTKPSWLDRLRHITSIDKVWGIGHRNARRLNQMNIYTVAQLAACKPALIEQQFSVVLKRTCLELNGQPCLRIEDISAKQQIISSRSFGYKVTDQQILSEALCGHVAKAAAKLRAQDSVCQRLTVFASNSPFSQIQPPLKISGQFYFVHATADTRALIAAAQRILARIYRPTIAGQPVKYMKAGIMLAEVSSVDQAPQDLFALEQMDPQQAAKTQQLMTLMDQVNRQRKNSLFIASQGIEEQQDWQMNREFLGNCYTTNLDELPIAH